MVRPRVPWGDTRSVDAVVATLRAVGSSSEPWILAWCAGSGVAGSSGSSLDTEVATIRGVVEAIVRGEAPRPDGVFFAASAGAAYGGSDAPPFTETTAPAPLGAYGVAKLRAEAEISRLAPLVPVLVGRIANLYGPGQDLTKNQGLVSQLCLSHLRQQPIGVYVSMDTLRDYLYVDDCARLVLDAMDRLLASSSVDAPVVKILASNTAVSIAHVIGECGRVLGRRIQLRMASSSLAGQQARDLRLRSVVWPDLDRRQLTPLSHGIHATVEHLRRSLMATHITP